MSTSNTTVARAMALSLAACFVAIAAPTGEVPVIAPATDDDLSARFLLPHAFQIEPDRNLRLHLAHFAPGPNAPPTIHSWEDHPAAWFFIRTGATQHNFDQAPLAPAVADAQPAAEVRIPFPCIAVIGADLQRSTAEVTRARLAGFVGPEGRVSGTLPRPDPAHPDRPLRVRRIESITTIIRAGQPGDERAQSVATFKTGQNVEIRLLMDPLSMATGSDIPVRAYVNGSGQTGRIFATAALSGRTQEFTTDSSGIGHFALNEPGPWRLEFHHLAAASADDPPDHDCVLYTATITFEAPMPEGAPR